MAESGNASTANLAADRAQAPLAPLAPMLWQQSKAEFLKLIRIPTFAAFSLLLPVMFFAFFGLPHVHQTQSGTGAGAFLIASFGAYGVVSVSLFSFGVSVAVERGQRMNVLMRATPLVPAVYLLAKILTALAFSVAMLVVLFLFGRLAGGVQMSAAAWLSVGFRLVAGSIPFIALGFALGYLAGPNSAPAIANLAFLLLSFASGLFVPLDTLPSFVQRVAPYLPTYRYAQLAWSATGADIGSLHPAIAWLCGYTVLFFLIALRAYRREEQAQFG